VSYDSARAQGIEAIARVIALRSMLPLGPGARDIAAYIFDAVEPIIRGAVLDEVIADYVSRGRKP
jgi:hypothetical protein